MKKKCILNGICVKGRKIKMNEGTKSIIFEILGFGFKAAWFILKCIVRYVIYFVTYIGYVCMP